MNDEVFNLSLRKFLKKFGITGQREIEKAVDQAIQSGALAGTETLRARARLEVEGLALDTVVEEDITLT
ncbi:MAG: hypothetical protein HKM89_10050 [Gemmatimonadales bacterium]|jgi:hypothetical protein|nr:hypothetical protein [Gemmatimonadales bacterium]